ncbi:hypothetical protein V474_15205 [Novosphingobium barchaimii LL02]|uniref:Linalool dehydratase/isomerase domain-containing protein n=1 Tax=Novosphingobium barchaimii LL02 TaxID=1114963 RepID=A0A0J7XX94_9SPHN|nr:hypothetical protein [Novosphingobium barchaimii]KMS56301.1 hypothetical protein V474_15205 [Novosphingobium barchaimii LL02]
MNFDRRSLLAGSGIVALTAAMPGLAAEARKAPEIAIDTPMAAPRWAVLQRHLIAMQGDAAQAFHDRYFNQKHEIEAFLRWGANDGPDDAIEAVNDWPYLYLMGGGDHILQLARAVQEAHFAQYSRAKTRDVPMGRNGMYVREFPPQMDWQHISEGLTTFNQLGLCTPGDRKLIERARRFADFYTGRDPIAANYDPKLRLIRSMFNGSIGPLMRPATMLDWAGDPFDTAPFEMVHGETSYADTLEHYREYTETVGDNPLNLHSTALGFNAWMLTGENRFRDWMLEYVEAWAARARANDGILPSNIGPDGIVGGGADGKWYGGTYGWGFSPINPVTGKREDRNRIPRAIMGFMNAYIATGDDRYLQVWRDQNARINAASRKVDGVMSAPTMHGSDGWYSFKPGPYRFNTGEIWYLSMRGDDRAAMASTPWTQFLDGKAPDWAEQSLLADMERVRTQLVRVREDKTTAQTRLADNPIERNPVSVTALMHQTMGAIHVARPPWSPTSPNQGGTLLFARLRHFDADRGRPGLPEDVAALVEKLDADTTTLSLVNLNPALARRLVIRGGGYGEHRIEAVRLGNRRIPVGSRDLALRIEPGSGARIILEMARHSQQPTLAWPELIA